MTRLVTLTVIGLTQLGEAARDRLDGERGATGTEYAGLIAVAATIVGVLIAINWESVIGQPVQDQISSMFSE